MSDTKKYEPTICFNASVAELFEYALHSYEMEYLDEFTEKEHDEIDKARRSLQTFLDDCRKNGVKISD